MDPGYFLQLKGFALTQSRLEKVPFPYPKSSRLQTSADQLWMDSLQAVGTHLVRRLLVSK
jgi:hypothetical protein